MMEEEMGPNGGTNEEEDEEVQKVKLEKSRRLYELTMRDAGEFSSEAICTGAKYAALLHKSSAVKSARLATKLFENSKSIFGIDHYVTGEAEEVYEMTTHCSLSIFHLEYGMVPFDILGWDMRIDCYLLKPPPGYVDDEEHPAYDLYKTLPSEFIAPRRRCIFSQVVPVIVFGLPEGPLYHLNNKVGETKTFSLSENPTGPEDLIGDYLIQFEDDDLEDCEVPPEYVIALTKVPPENAIINIELPASKVDNADDKAPASS